MEIAIVAIVIVVLVGLFLGVSIRQARAEDQRHRDTQRQA